MPIVKNAATILAAVSLTLSGMAFAQQREPIGGDNAAQVEGLAISTCQVYGEFGYSSYDQCYTDIVNMYPQFQGGGSTTAADFAFCSAFVARTGKGCFA